MREAHPAWNYSSGRKPCYSDSGWPPRFWDTFSAFSSFKALEAVASRQVWGSSFLLIGIVRLVSVLTGWMTGRLAGAFLGCVIWSFLASLFARNDYRATGVSIYYMFALAS